MGCGVVGVCDDGVYDDDDGVCVCVCMRMRVHMHATHTHTVVFQMDNFINCFIAIINSVVYTWRDIAKIGVTINCAYYLCVFC